MKKNILMVLLMIFYLTSCNSVVIKHDVEVIFNNFYSHQRMEIDTFIFEKIIKHNNYLFKYKSKQDSFMYVKSRENTDCFLINKGQDSVELFYCSEDIYFIKNEKYSIYKYISNKEEDGAIFYYMCDEIGLIMLTSQTWKNGRNIRNMSNKKMEMILNSHIGRILVNKKFYMTCSM